MCALKRKRQVPGRAQHCLYAVREDSKQSAKARCSTTSTVLRSLMLERPGEEPPMRPGHDSSGEAAGLRPDKSLEDTDNLYEILVVRLH